MANKKHAERTTIKRDTPFSVRLWYACAIRDMTNRKLAELSGISLMAVSTYMCGKHEPTVKNLAKMARVLGVSTDWLCGLREEMEDE